MTDQEILKRFNDHRQPPNATLGAGIKLMATASSTALLTPLLATGHAAAA